MFMSTSTTNGSILQVTEFILMGFPGIHSWQHWLSLPLALLYLSALLANAMILLTIWQETALCQPMFYFLAVLAVMDMDLSTTTMPRILAMLWFNARTISLSECFFQINAIHVFVGLESTIFLCMAMVVAMAFDRYVAICQPLRYTTILTNKVVVLMGLVSSFRAAIMVFPCIVLIKRLTFCNKNIIHHTYCENMAVVKLACSNAIINRIYGICVAFSVVMLDVGLITVSYVKILQAVFRLSSNKARTKALGTCAAHVCAILISYVPALFSFLTHRIGKKVSPSIHIIFASIYLLVPPAVNPLVYGAKTKLIRDQVLLISS
ncbi:olfactory receptor 52J3-like [Tachyglossus aculeatus]|uniref:olfactory receptor 52J3-like n=1 Tax=Tachyglossus aculeatus TaxID=9261 RepID=UPI0018F61009|nr:olfactory receptor 52J3-like [Tachyglossus aculeatus]